ncbi:MAG: hypothetical protein GPJ09_08800 [Microcystis aeruginosa SX13-01]|nr:hypothetical protein [Microcystis aeruginosa SX13-01]
MKRQPHSATILKRWRGEESPSVYGGEDVNLESAYSVSDRVLWVKNLTKFSKQWKIKLTF